MAGDLGGRLVEVEDVDAATEEAIARLRRLPYPQYLRTAHWQRIRLLALDRARHECALCPTTSDLEVHHRHYRRLGYEQAEDLVVLCSECHQRHHRAIALHAIKAMEHEPLKVTVDQIRWMKKP